MKFRPCIDIHDGHIKQIVGSSVSDKKDDVLENYVSTMDADYYARLYKKYNLRGGHVIILDKAGSDSYEDSKKQAIAALRAYPDGLQVGGGITPENAAEFIDAGAMQVIVTSYVFSQGKINEENLKRIFKTVGKNRLCLDLSCRKRGDSYYVVTDRWQRFTDEIFCEELLDRLSEYASEFLVHGVDGEGKRSGIEEEVIRIMSRWGKSPMTYAGGVAEYEDISLVRRLGNDKIDITIGSAMETFGGALTIDRVIEECNR